VRNLRGKGFERYPPVFSTAARTGFLAAVAAESREEGTLPMLLNMEYRHVRTLMSAFTRLRICRQTEDGVYEMDPDFGLQSQLLRYLHDLNADVGEWENATTIATPLTEPRDTPRLIVAEMFGSDVRAAVLVALGSTESATTESVAELLGRDPLASDRVLLPLVRAGLVAFAKGRSKGQLMLAERGSTSSLRALLKACESSGFKSLSNEYALHERNATQRTKAAG
jgi:hypothetical protein